MPFVKLDCGILNSTLWFEREAREVFITALLMAEPIETLEPLPQMAIHSLEHTGWSVPPGWYGFVPAASVGILHRAGVSLETGMGALERLGKPEDSSRSPEFEGRRLVRVDGGFIVLNYMKYRERDYTSAQRSARYRKRLAASRRDNNKSHRDITQAEAEAEAEAKKEKSGAPRPSLSSPKGDPFKDETITERAGRFIERYADLYPKHRKGARYAVRETRDYQAAVKLCATWPDERLDKLAVIFLTTDHEFAEGGSRTIPQFLALASWCDGRLAEHEHKRPA